MGNYKESKDFQKNWRHIMPDYVINYGEEGKVIIQIKPISNSGAVGNKIITEKAVKILNLLGLGDTKHTACKIHYIPELSFEFDERKERNSIAIKYDDNEEVLSFSGFEGIVCKKCFENPSMSANGFELFDEFKVYKKKKDEEIFQDKYKEQVRSATIRINNKFKKVWGLEEDVLIYSAIPIVTINPKFFH